MKLSNSMYSTAMALALAAAPAMAADTGQIAGYLAKTSVDAAGLGDDDGTGFGVKGWFGFGGPFMHFEYQAVTLDTSDIDVNALRLGGGMAAEMSQQVTAFGKLEYLDFGSDLDTDGFGIHGGVIIAASPQVSFSGSLGYLMLDDSDGFEIDLNGNFKFNKLWGAFLGYRTWMGEEDGLGDIDVSDLRAGITYAITR